jgi:heat shock protein HslJ
MRLLVIFLSLLATACTPADAPPSPGAPSAPTAAPDPEPGLPQELVPLLNTRWIMNDQPPNFAPTVEFGTDRASGGAGCNSWSAQYDSDGIALIFSDIVVTERLCPADAMETEQDFLQALRDTQGVRTENGEIMFDNLAGDEIARFRPLR